MSKKAWGAQKWNKVEHQGQKVVLVERDKDAQEWIAVEMTEQKVVRVPAQADVEVAVLDADTIQAIKKEAKRIVRNHKAILADTECDYGPDLGDAEILTEEVQA